jgi:uncharacterized protein (TIGR03382 family)
MITPGPGTLALAVALVWAWARRRRRPRVPGGPIIHRDLLEQAEREVRDLPAAPPPPGEDLGWGPGSPRSPIHL